jgi:hypothetical protein
MALGGRTAIGVLAALLVAPRVTAGGFDVRVTVVVRLDDLVPVPASDLCRAKTELERVMRTAGVDVTWSDGTVPGFVPLTLILVNPTEPSVADSDPDEHVGGEALPLAGRAYVYPNRLAAAANKQTVDGRVILGRVMAHELGHLLLPPNSHSRVGIMRPDVDFSQVGIHAFTADQAQAIRRALNVRQLNP